MRVDHLGLGLDPPEVLPEAKLARVAVRAHGLGPRAEGRLELAVGLLSPFQRAENIDV